MRVALQGMEMGGGGMKLSLNEYLIRPLFHNMAVVVLFIAIGVAMLLGFTCGVLWMAYHLLKGYFGA